jgi:hypothetical protein
MLSFKKELEKSERQREELSDHLEVNLILFKKKELFIILFYI